MIDDAASRDLLARILERDGCRVVAASSGPSGLELAEKMRPDAISLDVIMPGMDGWTVLARLKADPSLQSIPVLLITIVDGAAAGIALGASNVIRKPVDPQRLLDIVSGHVQSKGRRVLVVDDHTTARS